MTLNWPQIAAAVYQACTTYDQYLPQLSADVARSWAKTFAYYDLTAATLLAGVDRVYAAHGAGYRPLPADIARAARDIRKDRAERETPSELDARHTGWESKAADDIRSIATGFVPGPVEPTERLRAAEEALQSCYGKRESIAAIREFFAAKTEARKAQPEVVS
jgi:hypothetical protein